MRLGRGAKKGAEDTRRSNESISRQRYIPAYSLAVSTCLWANKDEALRLLEKATKIARPSTPASSAVSRSTGDSIALRGEPRFEALASKVMSGAVPETP